MLLRIFLDKQAFDCLCQIVPHNTTCRIALEEAGLLGNTRIVVCDDVNARELLVHAKGHCPTADVTIAESIRAAGLTP